MTGRGVTWAGARLTSGLDCPHSEPAVILIMHSGGNFKLQNHFKDKPLSNR